MNIKQEKFKLYDCWLHWYLLDRCNMDCAYCTLGPIKKTAKIPSIDIPSLISFLESTHKTFKISFTGGGEPFLVPNLIEACTEITKKHYISLITNLTSPSIKEFAERINPKRVLRILASAHIEELERRNLSDMYFNNFFLLREKGFNINATEVAYPPLLYKIKRYKQFFKKRGVELNFSTFLGVYDNKKYPFSYTKKELEIFGLAQSTRHTPKKHFQCQKICNAGYNVGIVNSKGDIYPCESIKRKIGNIYNKMEFKKNLIVCPFKFCGCPLNVYDSYLFTKSIREADAPPRKINSFFMLYNFFKTNQINLVQRFL